MTAYRESIKTLIRPRSNGSGPAYNLLCKLSYLQNSPYNMDVCLIGLPDYPTIQIEHNSRDMNDVLKAIKDQKGHIGGYVHI